MKKIQLFFMLNIFCSFGGLSAADKLMYINDTGQDLNFRIRSEQDPNNILVLHPDRKKLEAVHAATEQDIKEIINPVAGNPEVFLFKSDSVLSIPVERLYKDLRLRGWKTDYTPTLDGPGKTSKTNDKNSIAALSAKIDQIRAFPNEMRVYSLQVNPDTGRGILVIKDTDAFLREVHDKMHPLIIELEATKLEELEEYTRLEELEEYTLKE